MAELSIESEEAIKKYNLQITNSDRKELSKLNNDPDRQTKWAVNPLIQFLLERTMNEMCGSCGDGSVNTSTNQTNTTDKPDKKSDKKPDAPKPAPKPEPEPEPNEGQAFSLFD